MLSTIFYFSKYEFFYKFICYFKLDIVIMSLIQTRVEKFNS